MMIYGTVCWFLFIYTQGFLGVTYAGTNANCDNALVTQTCFRTLEERINSTLVTSYSRSYVPINNGIASDYVILASRDVVCDGGSSAALQCLISNFTACPGLIVGQDQFLYAGYIPDDIFSNGNTTTSICNNFRSQGCEARNRIFADCFGNIAPEFISPSSQDVTIYRACQTQFRSDMNCLLACYKDCTNVVFQQQILYFDTLRSEIVANNWDNFNNADEICSCKIQSGCQSALDGTLAQFAISKRFTAPTLIEEYEKILVYTETLCGINTTVQCAYTSIDPKCSIGAYKNRLANYRQYSDYTLRVCNEVTSQAYIANRQCILDNLSVFLATCKNVIPEANRNMNCTEMQYYYRCFYVILEDKCGSFALTMYEVFREYYSLPSCTISSGGSRAIIDNVFYIVCAVFIVIILDNCMRKTY